MSSCEKRDYQAIRRYIQMGKPVNVVRQDGHNPLTLLGKPLPGEEGTHLAIVNELLEKGCNPNAKPQEGFPIIYQVVDPNSDPPFRDAWQIPPYREGMREFLRILLQHGADPKVEVTVIEESIWGMFLRFHSPYKDTPLNRSCARDGDERMAHILLDSHHRLNLEFRNPKGPNNKTPLLMAIQSGRTSLVEKLLSKGANIYYNEDQDGMDVLSTACENGYPHLALLLLKSFSQKVSDWRWSKGPFSTRPNYTDVATLKGYTDVLEATREFLEHLQKKGTTIFLGGFMYDTPDDWETAQSHEINEYFRRKIGPWVTSRYLLLKAFQEGFWTLKIMWVREKQLYIKRALEYYRTRQAQKPFTGVCDQCYISWNHKTEPMELALLEDAEKTGEAGIRDMYGDFPYRLKTSYRLGQERIFRYLLKGASAGDVIRMDWFWEYPVRNEGILLQLVNWMVDKAVSEGGPNHDSLWGENEFGDQFLKVLFLDGHHLAIPKIRDSYRRTLVGLSEDPTVPFSSAISSGGLGDPNVWSLVAEYLL